MIIGAHISISSGIPRAIETCTQIGANAYQFFTRNPRGGAQRTIPDEEIAEGRKLAEKCGVVAAVGHLPYTVNLASPKERAYSFARECLCDDMVLLDRMYVDYAVVHPGSHVGSGVEDGMDRIVRAITEALADYDGQTMLLLETMAGQGTEIGGCFDELAELLDRLAEFEEQLGICVDSAHLFGAGYDLRTPTAVEDTLEQADSAFGLDRIKVFHLNDTELELGSRKDRHARIAKGRLGKEGIASIVNNEFLRQLPFILETPTEGPLDYRPQLELIRELASTDK